MKKLSCNLVLIISCFSTLTGANPPSTNMHESSFTKIDSIFIASTRNEQIMPGTIRPAPQLGKGVLLIANRSLNDPNFRQTVILITEYSEIGTVGLVINRSLQMSADKIFPQLGRIVSNSGNLYLGGPIGINKLQLLIRTNKVLHEPNQIFPEVYVVNRPKVLNEFLNGDFASSAARLYAGYAGWAAGQLESELMRGDWFLWYASIHTVFTETPESVWPELIQLVGAQWALYSPSKIGFSLSNYFTDNRLKK